MIVSSIGLGITLAAPLGPVSIRMINRGLQSGFWAALKVRLGGAIGNTMCLIAAHFSLSSLKDSPKLLLLCSILGASLLMHMGIKTIRRTFLETAKITTLAKSSDKSNDLLSGFVLSIANPVALVFWLGLSATTSTASQQAMSQIEQAFIIVGVILWGIILSAFLSLGKYYFNQRTIQFINLFSGLILLAYGVFYLGKNFFW